MYSKSNPYKRNFGKQTITNRLVKAAFLSNKTNQKEKLKINKIMSNKQDKRLHKDSSYSSLPLLYVV